jgi:glycosyltransferase involved in cell wall biosynthesis
MEGSSKSVYEAMGAGLACVVTHQSGSVIENGVDGYIINAFSGLEIREALIKVKNEDFLAMGERGKNKSTHFTWPRYSSTVLAEILNEQ